MKNFIVLGCLLLIVPFSICQTSNKLEAYAEEVSYNKGQQLTFVKIKSSTPVNEADVQKFINAMVLNNTSNKVAVFKSEKDELGFTHTKYSISQNGVEVLNKRIIAHCQKGKLVSLNGDLFPFALPINKFNLSENTALNYALKKVNAKKYRWENKAEELQMRKILNKPDFTYYPKGIKVIYEKNGTMFCAYQFNIYAQEPLYRANVFVDAASGKILGEQELICNVDVPGTAITKYSGTNSITCNQSGAVFSLRETTRGLGIETYNVNNTTTYSNTDFTNSSAAWTSTGVDQVATDAHWGAESSYDYYFVKFNRNSLDNAGYKLLSFVHYDVGFSNAFWDGTQMTYGDGDGTTFTPFTALDVCGHEITHGLVGNTAGLSGGEADALNESYADIFGTSIERFARPANWDWKLGSEISITATPVRDMQNPMSTGHPDTYLGPNWDAGGEPHTNGCPNNKWFYLLTVGGTGINGLGNTYNVTGIGNTDAEKIAYRALTVYFTPNTDYQNARLSTIQAAKDLFGTCSNQVIQTINAWYAIGVGQAYVPGLINSDFVANTTTLCSLPATVNFINTTAIGFSYVWNFGDGATATSTNASHSYTANGNYSVKLKTIGCASMQDSVEKLAYITVNVPATPIAAGASRCGDGSLVLNASGGNAYRWYASPSSSVVLSSGSTYTTPNLSFNTTYYVANTLTYAPIFGGILNNSSGTGYYSSTPGFGLFFDVLQNCTLNSVLVYAQTAGIRNIELNDGFGTLLNSTNINLSVGANTVVLNYALTPGVFYSLSLNFGSLADLYTTDSGVSYPYQISNCVKIIGSDMGGGEYLWFYNWKITQAENCFSPAVPVTATISPLPVLSVSTTATNFCKNNPLVNLSGTPSGGMYSGLGVSGTSFNPSTGTGTYNVVYSYTNSVTGCAATSSIQLQVFACTGLSTLTNADAFFSIYPNPANDYLTVTLGFNDAVTFMISDASGRVILSQQLNTPEENIHLSHLSNGLYMVSIINERGSLIKTTKLIKQ